MQHAGSIPLATFCLTHPNANFYSAVKYVGREYIKFKHDFIKQIDNVKDGTVRDQVDDIIKKISVNKSEDFAFFHSDMVGFGDNYNKISYTVTDSANKTYGLSEVFKKDQLSDKTVYVWINDVQGVHGLDYTFDSTTATLTL